MPCQPPKYAAISPSSLPKQEVATLLRLPAASQNDNETNAAATKIIVDQIEATGTIVNMIIKP
jgi:hypothetical protein